MIWWNRTPAAKPFPTQNADPDDPDAVLKELMEQTLKSKPIGEMLSEELDRVEQSLVNEKGNVISYNARSERDWKMNAQIVAKADAFKDNFDRNYNVALETSKNYEIVEEVVEEVTSSTPTPENSNSLLKVIRFPGKAIKAIKLGVATVLHRAECNVTLFQGSSKALFDLQQVSFATARDTRHSSSSSSSRDSRQTSSNAIKDEFTSNLYYDNKELFDNGGVSIEKYIEFIEEAGFDESWMTGSALRKRIQKFSNVTYTSDKRSEIARKINGLDIGEYKLIKEKGGDKAEEYSKAIIRLLYLHLDDIRRMKTISCLGSFEEIVIALETMNNKEFVEEMFCRLDGSSYTPRKQASQNNIWKLLASIISMNTNINKNCQIELAAKKFKIVDEFPTEDSRKAMKVKIELAKARDLPIFDYRTAGVFRVLLPLPDSKLKHFQIYLAIGKCENYYMFKVVGSITFNDAFGSLTKFYKLFKDEEEAKTICEAFNNTRILPTALRHCKLGSTLKELLRGKLQVVRGHVERAIKYEDMKMKKRKDEITTLSTLDMRSPDTNEEKKPAPATSPSPSTIIVANGSDISTTTAASSQSIKRETSSDNADSEMAHLSATKPSPSTIIVANGSDISTTTAASSQSIKRETSSDSASEMAQTLVCPDWVDPNVLIQLPPDTQQEIMNESLPKDEKINLRGNSSDEEVINLCETSDEEEDAKPAAESRNDRKRSIANKEVINLYNTSYDEEDTKPAAESRNDRKRSITNGAMPSTKRNMFNSPRFSRPRSNIVTKQKKELEETISDTNQIQYICELLNITFADGKQKATSLLIRKLAGLSKDELVFKFNEVFKEEVLPDDKSYVETLNAILNFLANHE
ncbi:predicted protein [Chaetoceros tenuissimus]|uniref:Uncharacterized protein n=1 Tax=Chaetoceros tenuissimus TaxID=426638 RepID=A0AAD3D7G7_9STRA|nr:predicted protein [Chaetoceros tenuissimus]